MSNGGGDRMNEDTRQNETEKPCSNISFGPSGRIIKEDVPDTLRIAQRLEQFVNDNGWSWCQMDRVYRVLKAAHQ